MTRNVGSAACCGRESAAQTKRADGGRETPLEYFSHMIRNCLQCAQAAKRTGRPVVGILCEFTPRELIMAAGAVPVCLCGGSAKTIPAAEEHLPANLCPLIKSTFGYHVQRSNPLLEMADLVVAETTCDGKKKMYELMAETRPMYVLELPQKVDDGDAWEHWLRELRKLRVFLEQRFQTRITDDKLRQAIATMNRERVLRRQLATLMTADSPPLTGSELLQFKSSISGMDEDFRQYERALAQYGNGNAQVAEAGRAEDIAQTGTSTQPHDTSRSRPPDPPVRVLLTGVPTAHGAERVVELVEGAGGLVVAAENCTGLKPILEDVDETASDPLQALAEKYFHLPCSVMTRNDRRLESLRRLAVEYRAECVVELIWQACLTYDVESHRVRQMVERELGLPYLRIETDYWPSDSARITLRVEALFETVRAGRARPVGV